MKNTNLDIAITHIVTRRKQTLVAALGVTIGVAIFLFMNSLSAGFTVFSLNEIFKNNAHVKIYKNDETSKPILKNTNSTIQHIIVNPQIVSNTKKIIDPLSLLHIIKQQPYVVNAIAQISFDAFYNRGTAQVKGNSNGVNIDEYAAMFNTQKYMVAGSISKLQNNQSGIIIGSGISEKLNLNVDDNISVTSSYGVIKVLKIVGIFKTGNSIADDARSYVNIATAQQFVKQGPSFVSNIYVNIPNGNKVEQYTPQLQQLTNYKVEDWKTTNADVLAGDKTRSTMMGAISLSILLVAAFGIYNILSATISQKINDIAILKATGFTGGDVIKIFIAEALIMGMIGTIIGLCFGALLIFGLSKVYMGGPVGYFPITFEPYLFLQSGMLGLVITILAGYFPARKAANVDPVSIFRK
jgi:lipoprotein-releasing system permease protein